MLVVVGGRQCGKTEQLVEWVTDKPGRAILCSSAHNAAALVSTYDLNWEQVLHPTFGSLEGRTSYRGDGAPPREVAIDDAEMFLQEILNPQDTLAAIGLTS